MTPLRILHVVPYYEQAWAYGGIPRLATTMTRALARRGHHVTVCTTDACDEHTRTASRAGDRRGLDVRIFPNLSNRLAYHLQFFTPIGLAAYVRSAAASFDVGHVHACHNLPGASAAAAFARAGVPYVVSPNGTALPIERRVFAKRAFAATAGRHLLSRAARVLAVTEAERAQLLTLGIAAAKIDIVPNPVETAEFQDPQDGSRFRFAHRLGTQPVVLFLGKLTPRKGIGHLVRAFARLARREAVLVIAGNDMGSGASVDALVRELGLSSRVIRAGLLRDRDRLDALAAADVVVYPSRDEVFGLVPIEALCCGTPVVVCGDSGCGEVIGRIGGGAVVEHADVPALSAAIESVLDRPVYWRTLARAAALRAHELFGPDVVCDRLEQVYDEVLAERTGAGIRAAYVGDDESRAPQTAAAPGVTFVVPVLNGRRWLKAVIDGILAQQDGRPFEIVAVDDGSTDGSLRVLRGWQDAGIVRLFHGTGRGAAAAINTGVREARHPIVCQVDQDVILQRGWLQRLLAAFDDPEVAAAQGHYLTRPDAGFWARTMGRDLEHRYSRIRGAFVDHVCTGNSAYRASALHRVGLLDEDLGYGYDNDLSYRLTSTGHRLAFCREATSIHCWREGLRGYLRQQFGVGYGRLDVIARHPRRVRGDDVSGRMMMLHGPAMLLALVSLAAAGIIGAARGTGTGLAIAALAIIGILAAERTTAGFTTWRRTGDPAALAFSVAHLARDCAWAAAIVVWSMRRLLGRGGRPAHSMPRDTGRAARESAREAANALPCGSLLVVVPAFNEAANLPRVVSDLHRVVPHADVLVVNDGSTDGTEALLPGLGVRWLTLSQRLGVGGAVRAGILYALRQGYDYAVRVDGDAQHRACDIARLLVPVVSGRADAAIGSRFLARPSGRPGVRRVSQAVLAACLSVMTRRRVTDPTSGFWLFGPRALRLLGRHHPAGYAEPELALLLSRNRLRVTEVPIRMRPRLAGRTSLTAPRAMLAFARTLLAIVIVPFRRIVEGRAGD